MEDVLLTKDDITAYINKLIVACMETKPVVLREHKNKGLEYTTKLANADIKFLESVGSVYMWVSLYDRVTVAACYTFSNNKPEDIRLQVDESGFRILDVKKGEHPGLATNVANLLNTLQFRAEVISSSKVLTEMAVIDELLENV